MATLPQLTDQQSKDLNAFRASLTPGKTTYLNPSDAHQKSIIKTMLELAGRTPERYPQLYKSLDSVGAHNGAALDKVMVVDAGKTKAGKATATVWASSSNPTTVKGGNLLVFDADSNKLIAQGANVAAKSGFLSCPTVGAAAQAAGKNLNLLYVGHTAEENGNTRFFAYASSEAVGAGLPPATVTDPVISQSHPPIDACIIAVGRVQGSPTGNADYIYLEQKNYDQPFLITPFTGSMALPADPDLSSLTIDDLATGIIMVNTDGSTTTIPRATQFTTDQKMLNGVKQGTPSNMLTWSYPFDGLNKGNNGYATTNSLVYNTSNLATEKISYFYFMFNIPLSGGLPPAKFYVCSKDSPEEPSMNCTRIANMEFYWHCAAKGTLVTMEDGSHLPIEKITNAHRVKTAHGKSLSVSATVLGMHASKAGETGARAIYKLTTENGKTITASGCHTICLINNSYRMIHEVTANDTVLTDEGESKVKSIEPIAHEGMFYGLVLGSEEEKKKSDFPHNHAAFFAGGIQCGDHQAMKYHSSAQHCDQHYMNARLKGVGLNTDFASALKDARF